MKVWTITSDTEGDGARVAVHPTEDLAIAHFERIVAASWESWVVDDRPMPPDAKVAYAALCDTVGFFDLITLQEHEVTLPDSTAWTVLLMLPDYWRSDQSCAADEIIRIWVNAAGPDEAVQAALIKLPIEMPDESEIVPEDFATVAIYPGHIFDQHLV